MASERHAPGVVPRRQIGSEGDGVRVGLLRAGPVASMVQDVAPEAIAVDVAARLGQHRVRLVRTTRRLFRGRDPAIVAAVVARHDRVGESHAERLQLRRRPRGIAGFRRQPSVGEVADGDEGRVAGVALGGAELEFRVNRIVQPDVDVRDGGPAGRHRGADAAVRGRVLGRFETPGQQVPRQRVLVLVKDLAGLARPAARRLAHLLHGPPGVLFPSQHHLDVGDVGVGGPEVRLELDGLLIEHQGFLDRTAGVLQRIGPVVQEIGLVLVVCDAGEGGLDEGDRLRVAPIVGQIDGIGRGLRLAVDILGRLGGQLGQIRRGAGKCLGQDSVAAHG